MAHGDERPRASELTGELPVFVEQALRPPEPDADTESVVMALRDLGVPEDEARAAVAERRVPLVLIRRLYGERPRYTVRELSAKAGVPVPVIRDVRAAVGLPLPERFSKTDLAWAKGLARLLEALPPEAVVSSARARGSALAAIARADTGLIRDELLLPMRRAGADDLTVAVALAEMARSLDRVSRELLDLTYRLHIQHQLSTELSAIIARSSGQEVELAVGFVDVVGYTALSSRIDPVGLDEILDAFERRVLDVISPRTDVAVVKFLGDAVMLVGPDATSLTEAMLTLTEPTPELEDAPLRGGLAFGATLVREGDYFGPPVNLAARLTDIARPWSLLAAESLVDVLDGPFRTRRIRPTRIRGVGLRRPIAVSWSADVPAEVAGEEG